MVPAHHDTAAVAHHTAVQPSQAALDHKIPGEKRKRWKGEEGSDAMCVAGVEGGSGGRSGGGKRDPLRFSWLS